PADIRRGWAIALAKAGIEDCHFHDLSYTAVSYLAMSGVRFEDIAEILGPRSLQTTRRSRHLTTAYTAGLVEKMAQHVVVNDHAQQGDAPGAGSPRARDTTIALARVLQERHTPQRQPDSAPAPSAPEGVAAPGLPPLHDPPRSQELPGPTAVQTTEAPARVPSPTVVQGGKV